MTLPGSKTITIEYTNLSNVWKLKDGSTVLAKYVAQTIKVEGTEHGSMHAIDVKKLSVKDDKGGWKEVQLQDEHHKMSDGGDAAKAGAPKADAPKKEGHTDHKH